MSMLQRRQFLRRLYNSKDCFPVCIFCCCFQLEGAVPVSDVWRYLDPDDNGEVTRDEIDNVLSDDSLAKVATALNQPHIVHKITSPKVEL